jgi:HEAT repeat protein
LRPDGRVTAALGEILSTLGVEQAAAYVRDPEQSVLHLAGVSARTAAAGPPLPREVAWGRGLVGEAADRTEALDAAVPDPYAIAVPMLLGDEAVGVVAIVAGHRRLMPAERDALLAGAGALARALAPAPLDALRHEIARHLAPPALAWLDTLVAVAARGERDPLFNAFPGVSRRVGREPLGSRSALVRRDLDLEIPLRAWRLDDAARAAILCAFAGDAEGLARDLYFAGDLRERTGALRGLAVVGRSPAALDAVVDAGRASALELFEAAIAENPYVSRLLPTEEFRKIVLKCAFVGVTLDRVVGLEARADEELSRMLLSYVSEREVAGRSVPADVWPIVALHPTPGLAAKLCGYLEHPAEAHRAAAARALARIGDPRARPFLEDRLTRETDPSVRRAVARAIF